MGLFSSLGKILKVVAIVAAVVAVGYLVAPAFTASIVDGFAAMAASLGEAVSSAFAGIGEASAASTVAEASTAMTGAEIGAAADAAITPGLAEASGALAGASGAATEAAAPAIADAAGSTIPSQAATPFEANFPAEAASNAAPSASSAAQVAANPATQIGTDAATQIGTNPATQVGFNAAQDSQAAWANMGATGADGSGAASFYNAGNGGGMLSNAFDATKQFVKDNPLLSMMGFRAASAAFADDPMKKKMEFDEWLRNQNSQSVTGSYIPARYTPQQPLQRVGGGNVFNRPTGMLGRTGG